MGTELLVSMSRFGGGLTIVDGDQELSGRPSVVRPGKEEEVL